MHTKTNSMKRYGNLYERICSLDNLRLAHQNAKKGKGWYQEVKMIDKDADRQAAAHAARKERDRLLLACDWAVLPDAKTERTAWETYRQALRDVPEQVGFPYGIDWPIRPGTGGLK